MQYFRVSIPPAVRPSLLRQMDVGSVTCAQIRVRAVHTMWGGQAQSNKSAKELTRRDRKKCSSSPCPARGWNPGSSYFDSLTTTELRPRSYIIKIPRLRNTRCVSVLPSLVHQDSLPSAKVIHNWCVFLGGSPLEPIVLTMYVSNSC